jgi:hypothetical protein
MYGQKYSLNSGKPILFPNKYSSNDGNTLNILSVGAQFISYRQRYVFSIPFLLLFDFKMLTWPCPASPSHRNYFYRAVHINLNKSKDKYERWWKFVPSILNFIYIMLIPKVFFTINIGKLSAYTSSSSL